MGEQGLDVWLSIKLLLQFQFSLRLLSDTRELIRWEIECIKSPEARILVHERLKLSHMPASVRSEASLCLHD